MNRHRQLYRLRPKGADIVAKVENRTTRRISLKSILGRACCRKALRRQYEGRWSFWYETMWSPCRHARNASAVFNISVLHPKKPFATISPMNVHSIPPPPPNNHY